MEPKILYSLLAVEHARLHVIGGWPHSAYKDATLRAIVSSIQSLAVGQTAGSFRCMACLRSSKLSTMPSLMRSLLHSELSKAA